MTVVRCYSRYMPKISYIEKVSVEEHLEVLQLLRQQMEKTAACQDENTELRNAITLLLVEST